MRWLIMNHVIRIYIANNVLVCWAEMVNKTETTENVTFMDCDKKEEQ